MYLYLFCIRVLVEYSWWRLFALLVCVCSLEYHDETGANERLRNDYFVTSKMSKTAKRSPSHPVVSLAAKLASRPSQRITDGP